MLATSRRTRTLALSGYHHRGPASCQPAPHGHSARSVSERAVNLAKPSRACFLSL